ncbi:hypothetical acetyltransferase [Photobacterium angustum S14]|uniref:Hypothetical acetyltransferase n=1 Tax=Photobacterium angustum (strain S14 / CCUG 15956) TaxID=314292 RepID=Q1ZWG5_PHOAS|nr:hypothetical acetyltransferase [Photobacterium angustum S14]
MENIIIRHSEDKDIIGVKAIYESEIAYGGTLQLPFPSLDRWTSRLSNLPQGCYSLVAEYEGEIVGQKSDCRFVITQDEGMLRVLVWV